MKIAIVTDTLADIPSTGIIYTVPSYVKVNNSLTKDTVVNIDRFVERTYTDVICTRSATKNDFAKIYNSLLQTFDYIISLHTSLKFTSVFLKASSAVTPEMKDNVFVFDSGQISTGLGSIVMKVERMILDEQPINVIKKEIVRVCRNSIVYITTPGTNAIYTSENINRNNIIIKPFSVMTLKAGIIHHGRSHNRMYLCIDEMISKIINIKPKVAVISHSLYPEDRYLKKNTYPNYLWSDIIDEVQQEFERNKIQSRINRMSPALISHLGMGGVTISYTE